MALRMKVVKTIRAAEWWEYKLPPILAIAYATSLFSDVPLYELTPFYLFYLASLVIGAIYVSFINDITDIDADLAAGKLNRMVGIPATWRWLFPFGCAVIGLVFGYFMWPDVLTVILYSMAWIAFSLYSIPPFRFKNRGVLGPLCDACGAHLFPTLTILSGISYVSGQTVDFHWFAVVGVWAFSFGLRGILWHQYLDRENDINAGIRTFATQVDTAVFKPVAIAVFSIEILAFAMMLGYIQEWLLAVFLMMYFILVTIRSTRYNHKPIILMTPDNRPSQVVMLDYYQVFFPIGLLLISCFHDFQSTVVLLIHCLLFPMKMIRIIKD